MTSRYHAKLAQYLFDCKIDMRTVILNCDSY